MKEKIYVEIAGIKLGIISEDGGEYVRRIAQTVETQINSMVKTQRSTSLIEAALFTAMNYCSKGEQDSKKVRNLETQVALYQANVNRLKKENEELRARLNMK
ncbi:MAG: cell division protein ZapA [Clostridia bacterium]|nr:cell division protein ZapA [Clostridia bacterium]